MVTFLNWLDALDRSVTRLVQAFLDMTGVIEKPWFGIVVSVLGTWLFSYLYYKIAGDELRHEAERLRNKSEELRKLLELNLYAQTNPGEKPQPLRGPDGTTTGLRQPTAGRTRIKAAMSGERP